MVIGPKARIVISLGAGFELTGQGLVGRRMGYPRQGGRHICGIPNLISSLIPSMLSELCCLSGGAGWLLEVSVVGVRALPLLAGRVLHALAHQVVAHVADALQRVREVRADLFKGEMIRIG